MNKILLLTALFLLNVSAFSQIYPFLGIYDLDSCQFESQCALLQLDTSFQNNWQIGKPAKPFFDTAYSLPNVLVTDTVNPYGTSNHSYFDLILPKDQWYDAGLILGFRHKFQTDSLIDGGYIEVSYDQGTTWTNVLHDATPQEFHSENLYTDQDTLLGGMKGFSGTSNGWIYTRIQWIWSYPRIATPPDTLIMRFHFISDTIQTNKDGWMIDNILISYADEGTSTQEMGHTLSKIEIMPNPTDNYAILKFENPFAEPLTLTLFNSVGQKIKQIENIKVNQFQLDKNYLTSGLYIVQLKNKTSLIATSKLIIK